MQASVDRFWIFITGSSQCDHSETKSTRAQVKRIGLNKTTKKTATIPPIQKKGKETKIWQGILVQIAKPQAREGFSSRFSLYIVNTRSIWHVAINPTPGRYQYNTFQKLHLPDRGWSPETYYDSRHAWLEDIFGSFTYREEYNRLYILCKEHTTE
ncbi:MAG: hypothetical protein U5P41_05450 [Gammaproteobacteria bacterium]|nr:hypothetical protein [Gammaproteobacteria bacterium]